VLVDIKDHAATNNITPTLNGSDVFAYGGVTPSANFDSLRLRPMTAPAGIGGHLAGKNRSRFQP
jgi:hypothetical protein